mmetsp:Transcript_39931/g.92640  ORF Transcript_39931/g.92640 Transcript_39931/m.92640 type:complete len:288 (-) Transcript_39931:1677-2540(-)
MASFSPTATCAVGATAAVKMPGTAAAGGQVPMSEEPQPQSARPNILCISFSSAPNSVTVGAMASDCFVFAAELVSFFLVPYTIALVSTVFLLRARRPRSSASTPSWPGFFLRSSTGRGLSRTSSTLKSSRSMSMTGPPIRTSTCFRRSDSSCQTVQPPSSIHHFSSFGCNTLPSAPNGIVNLVFPGGGAHLAPRDWHLWYQTFSRSVETSAIARPMRSARPQRPIRWMKFSMSSGRVIWITKGKPAMSIPRAATSVQMRKRTSPSLKESRFRWRSFCWRAPASTTQE